MLKQRFQDILSEIKRGDWNEVMRIFCIDFEKEHDSPIESAYFEIKLYFNYNISSKTLNVEPVALSDSFPILHDEQIFCLDTICITPKIAYIDAVNNRQFAPLMNYLSYSSEERPLWRELRYRFAASDELYSIKREELCAGKVLNGNIRVLFFDDNNLTLALDEGEIGKKLECNHEYIQKVLPGVKAGLWYDHDEFPALWNRLQMHSHTKGKSQQSHDWTDESKENLTVGDVFFKYYSWSNPNSEFPQITLRSIDERSVTLELKVLEGEEMTLNEIVLDKPNCDVEIWRKGPHSMTAKLCVDGPYKRNFSPDKEVPPGSYVTLSSSFVPETTTTQLRECNEYTDIPFNDTGYSLKVYGFIDGKMVVGYRHSGFQFDKKYFLGFLEQGKERTFVFGEDGEKQITVCWEIKATEYIVTDGELMDVPNVEEILLPEEVTVIAPQALLSAPLLRKITIPARVNGFSSAISNFYSLSKRKLEVCFEGDIQQWFDRSAFLANAIGRLFVQGREIHIYDCEELTIPAGVSRICGHMFARSNVLKSVILPAEVTEIGSNAFFACEKLCNIRIMGAAVVGSDSFACCNNVEEIYLADGVKALESGCFDFIEKTESIFIPASVKSVGRISSQNDGSCKAPLFRCAPPSRPDDWSDTWNLAYYDPRFGFGHGHDHYHPVDWGQER